jgi:sugar phosphate isomerase/epimerase
VALTASGGQSFSLSAAQRNERNILVKLQRSHATKQLYHDLWHERKAIEAVVAHHLGQIDPSACTVQGMNTWLIGQFNVCIIVHVHDRDGKISKKISRCPMYHKFGEHFIPGSVDEKWRAEVATYA